VDVTPHRQHSLILQRAQLGPCHDCIQHSLILQRAELGPCHDCIHLNRFQFPLIPEWLWRPISLYNGHRKLLFRSRLEGQWMGLGWHRTETKFWAVRKWITKLVKKRVWNFLISWAIVSLWTNNSATWPTVRSCILPLNLPESQSVWCQHVPMMVSVTGPLNPCQQQNFMQGKQTVEHVPCDFYIIVTAIKCAIQLMKNLLLIKDHFSLSEQPADLIYPLYKLM
jgi:hypothetical protein